jgi:hypothetical protein
MRRVYDDLLATAIRRSDLADDLRAINVSLVLINRSAAVSGRPGRS